MNHSDLTAETSRDVSQQRSRLTLRTMFLYLTLCAIFFGAWKLDGMTWVEALRVVATLLVLIGLREQIRDLYTHFRPAIAPARGQLAWQIAWRVGLAGCLAFFTAESVLERLFRSWFQATDMGWLTMPLPNIGWQLSMIMLLLAERPLPTRPFSLRRNAYSLLALLLALGICFFIVHDRITIPFLVSVAIRGIEQYQPARIHGRVIYEYVSQEAMWQQLTIAGRFAATALISTIMLGWCAMRTPPSRKKSLLGSVAFLSLGILAALNIWAQQLLWSGPFLVPNPDLLNPFFASSLLVIALLGVTAGTGLVLRDSTQPQAMAWIDWRRQFGGYLHEQWPCLLILIVISVTPIVQFVREYYDIASTFLSLGEIITSILFDMKVYLALLLTYLALANLVRWRSSPLHRQQPSLGVRPLPWLSAGAIWLFLGILLFSTLSTLVWLSWVDWMTIR